MKFQSAMLGIATVLSLWGCSLNLSDPEEDARESITRKVATEFNLLTGRWLGDSSFLPSDASPTRWTGAGALQWELFRDSTFQVWPSNSIVFPSHCCRAELQGDTLLLYGNKDDKAADRFVVELSFLGNYLHLENLSSRRHSFFHKRKPPDTAFWPSLVQDSLWILSGRRDTTGVLGPVVQKKEFEFLSFTEDGYSWETHADGISTFRQGVWAIKWDSLLLGTDPAIHPIVLSHPDTFLLWPSTQDTSDGLRRFSRVDSRPPDYLLLNRAMGYWRADTLLLGSRLERLHYGQFYDIRLDSTHQVEVYTNLDAAPRFSRWSSDSGYIVLHRPDGQGLAHRISLLSDSAMKLDPLDSMTLLGISATPRWRLSSAFGPFTDALQRFKALPYAHLEHGSDSLRFYFTPGYRKAELHQFELASIHEGDTAWLILGVPLGEAPTHTVSSGLRIALETGMEEPSRRKWISDTSGSHNLILRITSTAGSLWEGSLDGSLIGAEVLKDGTYVPLPDTVSTIRGSFRLELEVRAPLRSPLWRMKL